MAEFNALSVAGVGVGDDYMLTMMVSDTIGHVKAKIYQESCIPPDLQRLCLLNAVGQDFHGAHEPRDDETLSGYGVATLVHVEVEVLTAGEGKGKRQRQMQGRRQLKNLGRATAARGHVPPAPHGHVPHSSLTSPLHTRCKTNSASLKTQCTSQHLHSQHFSAVW